MSQLNVLITGASGRMGKSIIHCIHEQSHKYRISGLLKHSQADIHDQKFLKGNFNESSEELPLISSDFSVVGQNADVLIDFSLPEGTMKYLPYCVKSKIPMVIGTTGFSDAQFEKIKDAAKKISILYSANMSIGINLLSQILKGIPSALADSFDIEIVDTHHRDKRDAPSGTALLLANSIADSVGIDLKNSAVYGRSGSNSKRKSKSIGFSAIRGGDVVGEHSILFLGDGEKIVLNHQATDRLLFARGALFSASWLVQKKEPGLYALSDALALK